MRAWLALGVLACAPLDDYRDDTADDVGGERGLSDTDGDADTGQAPIEDPDCELLAHWAFDEGEGDTAHDASGQQHDLELAGPAWIPGVRGTALSFDGLDDRAYAHDGGPTELLSVTMSAWIQVPGDGDQNYIACATNSKSSDLCSYGFGVQEDEVGPIYSDGQSGAFLRKVSVELDTWQHVGIVLDGPRKTWRVLVQGEQQATGELLHDAFPDLGGPFVLGGDEDTEGWQFTYTGLLDELKIVSCALSNEQLAADFTDGDFGELEP